MAAKKKTKEIPEVSSKEIAEKAGVSVEEEEAAAIASSKAVEENDSKKEEYFFFRLNDEVKQAFREGKLRIRREAFHKNIAGLAHEGHITVSDERDPKSNKRIVDVDMGVAQKAITRYEEYEKNRPVSEPDAYDAIVGMQEKIQRYNKWNKGLNLDGDGLLEETKSHYYRIRIKKTTTDFRPVIQTLTEVDAKVESTTSEFLFGEADQLLQKARTLSGFDDDLIADIEGRITDGKDLEDFHARKRAALDVANDLRATVSLGDTPDFSNAPREQRGRDRFERRGRGRKDRDNRHRR
jgi:hypothetical protein